MPGNRHRWETDGRLLNRGPAGGVSNDLAGCVATEYSCPKVLPAVEFLRCGRSYFPVRCRSTVGLAYGALAGLARNFQDTYLDLVDEWWRYDNSDHTPQLILTGANARY